MFVRLFFNKVTSFNANSIKKNVINTKWKIWFKPQLTKFRQLSEKSGELPKAFLLYHYKDFPINYARASVVAGVTSFLTCAAMVSEMHKYPDDVQSEIDDRKVKGPFNIYGGANAYILPPVCILLSIGLWYGVSRICTSLLKKVLVSTDRKVVTLVTYSLLRKEHAFSVPARLVTLKGERQVAVNAPGRNSKHWISVEGTITNKALFESVMGVYKGPKIDI
nr:uncharacterized protein LOC101241962 [Ciona intestinalis]|eukprot:XP_004226021.1 uncharacterized protein LOC101241962 [Ciona intestinalis]